MLVAYPLHHFNRVKGLLRKYPFTYVKGASKDLYIMKEGNDREPVKTSDY